MTRRLFSLLTRLLGKAGVAGCGGFPQSNVRVLDSTEERTR